MNYNVKVILRQEHVKWGGKMQVKISNAANIVSAEITLVPESLNIKYGNNGIGKSTIAKSIAYKLNNDARLSSLTPYGSEEPIVIEIPIEIKSCLYFDKDYVDRYLFQEDIQNNSYEIVVKTSDFDKSKAAIEELIGQLVGFSSSPMLAKFVKEINNFDNEIKFKNSGEMDLAKKIGKGLKSGNFDKCIGEPIKKYSKYIIAANNHLWSEWFQKGTDLVRDNECPFCLSKLRESFDLEKKEIIDSFNSTRIRDNIHSKEMLQSFSLYLTKDQRPVIESITSSTEKPNLEQSVKLNQLLDLIKIEKIKVEKLASLSPVKLIQNLLDNSIENMLSSLTLNESFFKDINPELHEIASSINKSIEQITGITDNLKAELGALNGILKSNIKRTKKYINDFLEEAGIPYEVDIETLSDTKYKSVLKPRNINVIISSPRDRLSYGEQNAISLVLFSIEAYSKNADLVILDDPISSYDNNKKYAIFHQLFKPHENKNFYGRTTLLLTHDLAPVIDNVKNGLPTDEKYYATCLISKLGNISEIEITNQNLKNSIILELKQAKNKNLNVLSRLIHLRRYLELNGTVNTGEYDVVSSLIHMRPNPKKKISRTECIDLDPKIQESAYNQIINYIDDFDYIAIHRELDDNEKLRTIYKSATATEKLHITRAFIEKNSLADDSKVLWKFICETYHIENDYVFNLDTEVFEIVPEYIIQMCDKIIEI